MQHLKKLMKTAMSLPRQLRLVCTVQFFAWVAWFPFTFFSTEFIKELAGKTAEHDFDGLQAVRIGSRALMYMSLVSTVSALMLPVVVRRSGLPLKRLWTGSMVLFAMLMFAPLSIV